jgi:hypothetical protein
VLTLGVSRDGMSIRGDLRGTGVEGVRTAV